MPGSSPWSWEDEPGLAVVCPLPHPVEMLARLVPITLTLGHGSEAHRAPRCWPDAGIGLHHAFLSLHRVPCLSWLPVALTPQVGQKLGGLEGPAGEKVARLCPALRVPLAPEFS